MNKFYINFFLKILILISVINLIKSETKEERLIKEELVKYFQSIDSDEDHQLTVDELARWIRNIHNVIIDENVDSQWNNLEKEIVEEHTWQDYEIAKREIVNWNTYSKKIFEDHYEDRRNLGDQRSKEEIKIEFEKLLSRFEKRWKFADEDGTDYLSKEEFKFYLHPEESKNETIIDLAIQDLKNDLDLNNDGSITFDEYFEHIKSISNEDERQDKDFEQINKENFEVQLDKNKNGVLDLDEIKTWMIPDFEKYKMEAAQLLDQTDLNRDNELQMEELIDGFDKFYNLLPPKFYSKLADSDHRPSVKHDEF